MILAVLRLLTLAHDVLKAVVETFEEVRYQREKVQGGNEGNDGRAAVDPLVRRRVRVFHAPEEVARAAQEDEEGEEDEQEEDLGRHRGEAGVLVQGEEDLDRDGEVRHRDDEVVELDGHDVALCLSSSSVAFIRPFVAEIFSLTTN